MTTETTNTVDTISEPEFLLTELRYTLGQLHVQVLDIDEETRTRCTSDGRSIEGVLQSMVNAEQEYQRQYAELLGVPAPDVRTEDDAVPLPLSETGESSGPVASFEHSRAHTISMLEHAGQSWTSQLIDLVKHQVRDDRQCTSELADVRRFLYDQDQRPDLYEPLAESH